MQRQLASGVGAAVLVVALLGCDSSNSTDSAADSSPTAAKPSASGTTSAPPGSAAPAGSTPPTLRAADGSDVATCGDGDCQVLLTGPTTIPLDGVYLRELLVTPKGEDIEFSATTGPGSSLSGGISVGCVAVLTASGGRSGIRTQCGADVADGTTGVVIRALEGNGSAVVLDIATS